MRFEKPILALCKIFSNICSFVIINFICFIYVLAPAQDISLVYTKPNSDLINLTCNANGVFPEPEIKLSWGAPAIDHP